jgi:hypothetical protein
MTTHLFRTLGALTMSAAIGVSLIAAGIDGANSVDQQFATQAMHQLLQGVSNADVAQSGSDANVKSLASTIQSDQVNVGTQLASLSSYYGINVSTDPLKPSTDAAGYVESQKTSLKSLIAMFENEEQNGGASQLRTFAAQSLPILQKDLASLGQ